MTTVDRCYYRSATFDPESQLPLYVLDLTHVPSSIINTSTDTNNDLQLFMDALVDKIPDEKHTLVIFTNGLAEPGSVPSVTSKLPINLIKIIKLVPTESKSKLLKLYIVHGNWILKSVVDIFTKLYTFNSAIKPTLVKCDNLTSLSHHIDITKIPISLHTYIIDKIQFKNQKIILNKHLQPLYGEPLTIYTTSDTPPSLTLPLSQFQRIFNNLIAYLSREELDINLTQLDWQTIIKCTTLSRETKISIDILSECLKREQLVSLSDYSFVEHYIILVKFILKLSNSNNPLIPLPILLSKVDFTNINHVNTFLNKILLFKHTNSQLTNYDNAYILIKIFKLFKYLTQKLQREAQIIEPQARNLQKAESRLVSRLVLSFTKILYTDSYNGDDSLVSNSDDDDLGFDNLFKLINAIIENYDKLTIFNTQHTIEDFNNHINFQDFLAFENFKVNQLNQQIVNNLPQSTTSPVKPKKNTQITDPPTPPFPRKTPLFQIPVSTSTPPTSSSTEELDFITETIENLEIDVDVHQEDMFQTPVRSHRPTQSIISTTSVTDLVVELDTPTKQQPQKQTLTFHETIVPMVNNNLRKYTEKDLAVKERAEKQELAQQQLLQHAKEVEKGVRRGERKVSRLARLYEEKLMQ